MKTVLICFSGLTMLVLLGGCPRVNSPRDPVYLELQKLNRTVDEGQRAQQQKLDDLSNTVDQLALELSQSQRQKADSGYTFNQLLDELSIMKQQLADSTQQFNDLIDRVTFLQRTLDTMNMSGRSPAPASTGSEASSTEPLPASISPDALYQIALNDYYKNNFELAIHGFNQFISQFPTLNLAGNAQYWIGECYYSMQKYDQAYQAFDLVLQKYSGNSKTPSAMLKQAFCLIGLKQDEQAKIQLQKVILQYPLTREAELAKERLQQN